MSKTAEQIIGEMVTQVSSTIGTVDTRVGTVLREAILSPVAVQLEGAYAETAAVEANHSIITPAAITDAAMDAIAANFGLTRFAGSPASGSVRFSRFVAPASPISIPVGSLVSTMTSSDELSFRTLVTSSLSSASSKDPVNGDYYVDVAVIAQISGSVGNVAAGAINTHSIGGIDSVSNLTNFTGGKDIQTNTELAALIQSRAQGNMGTKGGYSSLVRSNFAVDDVQIIGPADTEMRRLWDPGAVDVIILSSSSVESEESVPATTAVYTPVYLPLTEFRPIEIKGLDSLDAEHILVAGTDYLLTVDTVSNMARSYRELTAIQFNISTFVPKVGSFLTLRYNNNQIVRVVQSFLGAESNLIVGANPLVKSARNVGVTLTADVKIFPSFSTTVIQSQIQTALTNKSNSMLLGDDLQSSDIISIIGNISGVDFIDLATFSMIDSRSATASSNIVAGRDEIVRITSMTINVS